LINPFEIWQVHSVLLPRVLMKREHIMIKLIRLFVGFGERRGADSQRGGRMALCHAVATRQSSGRLLNWIISFEHARHTAIVNRR
jgi:hypothetical protein